MKSINILLLKALGSINSKKKSIKIERKIKNSIGLPVCQISEFVPLLEIKYLKINFFIVHADDHFPKTALKLDEK
jgi:hypothetical protein